MHETAAKRQNVGGQQRMLKCASTGGYRRLDVCNIEFVRNLSEEKVSVCLPLQGQASVLELTGPEVEGYTFIGNTKKHQCSDTASHSGKTASSKTTL